MKYLGGGKVKLGSSITRIGSFNDCNLLKGIYTVSNAKLNGSPLSSTPHVVERQMVFTCTATYLLDDNEPKCILSPSRLRIPNSSYKLLGYIPDISGHGNHGVIYNSAYAEGSGVNEDGSYQFDGVDDFVTIPTVTGGKQVLMKVNWQSDVGAVTLYDQRLNISDYEFAIYNGTRDLDDNPVMAYQGRNNGQTYIDGILNSNIMASELKAITHNITITNELSLGINNTYPVIGSTRSNTHFAQMSLYDFMLFDEISTDDKIKELNKYVGVEAKVELPPYYWDTYGKTNSDADRDVTQQNQRFQDRQVIDSEMFGLYKSQIDADFLLYKGNRDNYDSLKAEISELKTQVAVSAAIRPYQDKLIQCEIERAFTAGINYVDKKTCNVIYGVTCLPNEPTTTGLVGRNANGCLPCGFTQTASTPAT